LISSRLAATGSEEDRLPDLPADRIRQGVFEEGVAEEPVGGFGEESLFEFPFL
jgi:hypothetical protein